MFPIFDVSASVADRPETLGSKEKLWLTPQTGLGLGDELHLFKIGRIGTGENWAEKTACEIAKLLGLPCADYHLATCRGVQGVISPRFLAPGAPLYLGNTVFSNVDKRYDGTLRFKQVRYKLLSALAIVRSLPLQPVEIVGAGAMSAIDTFVGYLVFDALIGNTDRHHENWGVTAGRAAGRADDRMRFCLAPSFDHASSLGRELSDTDRKRRIETRDDRSNVAAYAEKARSAFYGIGSTQRTMTSREVVTTLAQAHPAATNFWAKRVAALIAPSLEEILDQMPDTFISPTARQFGLKLLAYNQSMIREIANV